MLVMFVLAPAAGAQGNDISCPPGSAANAAGTTCTDPATGQQVEPTSQTLVFPDTSITNPCPELFAESADGTCVPIPIPDPAPKTPTPTPTPPSTLPATGGLSPVLLASILLLSSGLTGLAISQRH